MTNTLIITGGSRGIGEKTIDLFMRQGWQAINISRTENHLSGVKNFSIDLSDRASLAPIQASLVNEVKNAHKLCLVHNAASLQKDEVASLDEDQLRAVLELNLVAAVSLNKLFIPQMKPGSSIIYMGSTLSEQAVAHRASYVISKHAVVGLMRATCQDLAAKNINTCCICPGFVKTSMLTEHADMTILNQFIKQKVSAGRLIEPHEIADLIYFCAEHPIMNGSLIHANLGQIMN